LILGLAGSKEKAADPVDFVIHGDAGRSTVLGDQEEEAKTTAEERRESQQSMIDALKAAYPTGKE
jgi:hypothetical protein